jgi:hypothetical protein
LFFPVFAGFHLRPAHACEARARVARTVTPDS